MEVPRREGHGLDWGTGLRRSRSLGAGAAAHNWIWWCLVICLVMGLDGMGDAHRRNPFAGLCVGQAKRPGPSCLDEPEDWAFDDPTISDDDIVPALIQDDRAEHLHSSPLWGGDGEGATPVYMLAAWVGWRSGVVMW